VAADKTFCVYLAKDESIIRRHAELSGFPASKITEIGKMIDTLTGGPCNEELASLADAQTVLDPTYLFC
jgi:Nickel responsive protein SCO4226-like